MSEKPTEAKRFNWRLPAYAAVSTLIFFLPFVLSSADFGAFFYVVVAAPFISLVLIVAAVVKKGRRWSVLSMLATYWAVSAILVLNYSAVRDTARWLLWSKEYKAETLRQADSGSGEFKHTDWDSWGFAGENTVVYLVFDPNDSLGALPKQRPPGKIAGVSCEVSRIHRLESHWYAVTFYTDTSWGHCK
jgi:hypothetical protein